VLKGCVEDLYDGRGGIAVVTGDRGMGKSFLVAEVRQHFVRQGALLAEACDRDTPPPASPTWLQGRCRSYDQSWPYSMWHSLLRGWLGAHRGEPEEAARDRLRRQAEAVWGERLAEHYPYLATFLSLPPEEVFAERVRHLDAEGLRQQFFLTVRSWAQALAERGPLVLAFEDLHWADSTSLELLEYCLPVCDRESLLWLFMFRPDRVSPAWGFRHRVETEYPHRMTAVTLPPLTESQSCEFIEHLIGPDVLPAEMCALVVERAEGNPYYIAELTRSLIEQGVLAHETETGRWRATPATASLDLPDTLQSLLLARIDHLSADERHVLQMAAVIGSVFWSEVLRALAGETVALQSRLTALQRGQLIQERGRVPDLGMEYAFKSTLIRDVAHASLLSSQRAAYHLQVAEYFEYLLGPEALAQYYTVLAYHYRQAGNPGKELSYTVKAAERARGVYANAEALESYNRALELLDGMAAQAADEGRVHAFHPQQFEVLNGRREVLYLMGDFEAGQVDAHALLRLARQLADDSVWLIDALLQQPGVATWQSLEELEAGIPMAEEALDLARQLGDRQREMHSLFAIANQRLLLSDPTWLEVAERALELARQLGDRRYEARLLSHIGTAYAWSDQPRRSLEYLESALPISRALDDRITEVHLLSQIGLRSERSGDYYRLLTEYHQRRLQISREIGYRPGESDALISCGQTQGIYLGDYEGGLAVLEEGRSIQRSIAGRVFGAHTDLAALLRVIQILSMQGEYDEALAILESTRHLEEQETHEIMRAGLRLVSAILYNAMGDEETSDIWSRLFQVLELVTQVRQLVVDTPLTKQFEMAAACEAAAAHLGLAQAVSDEAERQTHLRQALESSRVALDIYEWFGFAQVIECVSEEILFRHSQALMANGLDVEAAACLQRAY
ncbi:MAG: AAA family ATPase, partial [Anaerolineae bacterium]|nr:AAA family ATPase [Anaerolineae bacterium]